MGGGGIAPWVDMSFPCWGTGSISPSRQTTSSWNVTLWIAPRITRPARGDHLSAVAGTVYGRFISTSTDVPNCSWSSKISIGLSWSLILMSSSDSLPSATEVRSSGRASAIPTATSERSSTE